MRLYEENGVYNFYLKVGGKDGRLGVRSRRKARIEESQSGRDEP